MQSFFTQTTKTLIRLCDAPTDLSLHWMHMSEGTFSDFAATTCLPTTVLTMRMKPSRMNPFHFLFNISEYYVSTNHCFVLFIITCTLK